MWSSLRLSPWGKWRPNSAEASLLREPEKLCPLFLMMSQDLSLRLSKPCYETLEDIEFGSCCCVPPPGIPEPHGSALRSDFSPRLDFGLLWAGAKDRGLIFIEGFLKVQEAAWQSGLSLGLAGKLETMEFCRPGGPSPPRSGHLRNIGLNDHLVGIICSKIQLRFSLLPLPPC